MKLRSLSRFAVILVLPLMFSLSACDDDNIAIIGLQIDPLCVELNPSDTQQFNITIFVNEVAQAGANNNQVTWSVIGGNINGTISNDAGTEGFYTAPATVVNNEVRIEAVSKEDTQKSTQASVLFTGACP